MSAEDIALVVVHLEDAGVPVELDDSLFGPRPRAGSAPIRSAEILSFPQRPGSSPNAFVRSAPLQAEPSAFLDTPVPASRGNSRAHWAVIGSIFLLLLAAILISLYGA
jgi:hypothetical protein